MTALAAALGYLKMGFSIIPVGKDKKPLIKWEGYQNKRAAEEEIRAWFKKWPDANIGIVTGTISNLAVIDIDTDEGKHAIQEYLPEDLQTPICNTPSDGNHLYFRCPDDKLSNNARVVPGCDLRANGGYVVAPPSINGNGKTYRWIKGLSIEEVTPAALPSAYLQYIRKNSTSLYTSNKNNSFSIERDKCDAGMFSDGRRDNDLFHVANILAKGGMPEAESFQVLKKIAKSWGEEDQGKWFSDKIQSAIKRQQHRELNLTREIEQWAAGTSGDFDVTTCANELQGATGVTIRDKSTIRKIFQRLREKGIIQKSGKRDGVYRLVDDTCEEMDIINVSTESHSILLPLGLRDLVKIMPRNIIIAAGAKSSGKTAFLLNTAYLNRKHKNGVYYYNSEMGVEELRIRIDEFTDTSLTEWNKIKFLPRSGNFGDVIKKNPDAIHIIDFLELHDEFYKVGLHIRDVYDALGKGVAIIALQKKTGQSYGYGGAMSIEKSRLYLTLDYGIMTITDAKIFAKRGINPRGMQLRYKLVGGSRYIDSTGWLAPEEYRGGAK